MADVAGAPGAGPLPCTREGRLGHLGLREARRHRDLLDGAAITVPRLEVHLGIGSRRIRPQQMVRHALPREHLLPVDLGEEPQRANRTPRHGAEPVRMVARLPPSHHAQRLGELGQDHQPQQRGESPQLGDRERSEPLIRAEKRLHLAQLELARCLPIERFRKLAHSHAASGGEPWKAALKAWRKLPAELSQHSTNQEVVVEQPIRCQPCRGIFASRSAAALPHVHERIQQLVDMTRAQEVVATCADSVVAITEALSPTGSLRGSLFGWSRCGRGAFRPHRPPCPGRGRAVGTHPIGPPSSTVSANPGAPSTDRTNAP
jgi:hypothetical protein